MIRRLPGALDPGGTPELTSPKDVLAWVRSVDWLVESDRALVLHLAGDGRLTCLATAERRARHLGPLDMRALAYDALRCDAAAVVAVDVRRRVPTAGPSSVDRRRHQVLRSHLAVHGVALLDTVLAAPDGGASVTGSLAYPLGSGLSWLKVHVPDSEPAVAGDTWTHDGVSALANVTRLRRAGGDWPTLSFVDD